MSDIVERLRESAKIAWGYPGMLPWPEHGSPLPNEAADTIEALRAENARLRKQLEKYDPTKILGDQRIGVSGTKAIQWPSPAYPYDARAAMGENDD